MRAAETGAQRVPTLCSGRSTWPRRLGRPSGAARDGPRRRVGSAAERSKRFFGRAQQKRKVSAAFRSVLRRLRPRTRQLAARMSAGPAEFRRCSLKQPRNGRLMSCAGERGGGTTRLSSVCTLIHARTLIQAEAGSAAANSHSTEAGQADRSAQRNFIPRTAQSSKSQKYGLPCQPDKTLR